jgi:hypothetical protein
MRFPAKSKRVRVKITLELTQESEKQPFRANPPRSDRCQCAKKELPLGIGASRSGTPSTKANASD